MIEMIKEAFHESLKENQWLTPETKKVASEKIDAMLLKTVFPAGILQPVFYSEAYPWSMNFGGIGVVIGHEITHGFDDKGRQYDKEGNVREWWDNETVVMFEKKAQCIEDQYAKYEVDQVKLKVNGKNTKGENIADNGGLKQAFKAYLKWSKQNKAEQLLPGINYSHKQLFFINYAQIWCGSMNDKEFIRKIKTSVHSPGMIR
uniref:Peptidase M13 C-terminal domain-containing protein n=1 Tax=Romanomermis culicivorax TaxID=13658 RepID=A0A915JR62_ROMCU